MIRLFRALLWLYPPTFRRRFGREMRHLLESRAGRRGRWELWRFVMRDLVRSLPLAWHDALRPRAEGRRSRRQARERTPHPNPLDTRGALRDTAYAVRGFIRAPVFTVLAVSTMALGIGVNGTMYTVVHHLMLDPLPLDGADRVVYLMRRSERFDIRTTPTYTIFAAWRANTKSYDALEAYEAGEGSLVGGREPLVVSHVAVTPTFMSAFGTRLLVGRALSPADGEPGAPPVAVLSEGLWRQAFGADPDIVGRTVRLDESVVTVVGVRQGHFQVPFLTNHPQIWTVLPRAPVEGDDIAVTVLGRLEHGTSLEQAQAELDLISIPGTSDLEWTPEVLRPRAFLGAQLQTGLWVLFGAVGFVLLIACANFANMILAKGVRRGQEIAVRAALGASRGRIVRLLLAESVVLCLVGGLLAVLLAYWGLQVIATLGPKGFGTMGLDNLRSASLDGTSLAFTLGTSLLTGLLTGVVSALRLSHIDIGDALRLGNRYGFGERGQRSLRQALVSLEVALALVLVLGAGLMVKSFYRLQRVDPGFDPTNLGSLRLRLPEERYPDDDAKGVFIEQLLQAVRGLPTVESATLTSGMPPRLSADLSGPIVEGYEDAGAGPSITSLVGVTPEFFDVVRTAIVRGRSFTADDGRVGDGRLAVINDAFARRYWGRDDALGQHFRLNEDGESLTVIGVAQDIKAFGLADDPDRMQVYYLKRPETVYTTFAIRATTDFTTIVPSLKQQVARLDPDLPIREAVAVEDDLADTIAREQFTTALLTAFAALAIVLAVAGIYAVVSLAVTQRLQELGIRIALGAEPRNIMSVVLKQGMRPVALGVMVGLAVSAAFERTLEGLLFGVSGTDPAVWAAAAVGLAVVAAAACYVPARRAMRLDPVEVLRAE